MASDINESPKKKLKRFTPRAHASSVGQPRLIRPSVLLSGVGLIALGGAVGWLGLFTEQSDMRVSIQNVEIAADGGTQLTGARYMGTTKTGRAYEITAATALEDTDDTGLIKMVLPTGFITLLDGERINIVAQNGDFSKTDNLVNLKGAVVLKQTKDNVTMTTEALLANIDAGEMQSDVPVKITSPEAHIIGQNIRVSDHGNLMKFGGASKMVLYSVKTIN